jgi:hypothetical protein
MQEGTPGGRGPRLAVARREGMWGETLSAVLGLPCSMRH